MRRLDAVSASLFYPRARPSAWATYLGLLDRPELIHRLQIQRDLVLAECVSIGYTAVMKDSGFRIRIERELREKFLATCREQDRPAAQVLREFMRDYVRKHRADTGEHANKARDSIEP